MSTESHLLILDLDETLLFADDQPLHREADFRVDPYFVYRRPFLDDFLAHVSRLFEVAVWTSSSAAYAAAVCEAIFPPALAPSFVWARDRCTPRRNLESDKWTHAKHLVKLKRRGYDLRRVLVVDDSPEKHERNFGNLVRVAPYFGDLQDDELGYLAAYLEKLSVEPDVRAIEKRQWRTRVTAPASFERFAQPLVMYDADAFSHEVIGRWGAICEWLAQDAGALHAQMSTLAALIRERLARNDRSTPHDILAFLDGLLARDDLISEIPNAVEISFLDLSELESMRIDTPARVREILMGPAARNRDILPHECRKRP